MLTRDKEKPYIVHSGEITSRNAQKMIVVEGYQLENFSLRMDQAQEELGFEVHAIVRAHKALLNLFSQSESPLVFDLKFLLKQNLTNGAGFVMTPDGKQVIYGMTDKGSKFFNIMFGHGKGPRLLSKRNVDNYTLVKYDTLENCLPFM